MTDLIKIVDDFSRLLHSVDTVINNNMEIFFPDSHPDYRDAVAIVSNDNGVHITCSFWNQDNEYDEEDCYFEESITVPVDIFLEYKTSMVKYIIDERKREENEALEFKDRVKTYEEKRIINEEKDQLVLLLHKYGDIR